jgi:uncharacterized membrane protein required for colicin V production
MNRRLYSIFGAMKKFLFFFFASCVSLSMFAQAQHEAFKQDQQLQAALLKYDMREFVNEPVSFVFDTLERQVNAVELNKLMKTYIPVVKNTTIKKASETNNGYVQSFGMYTKEDDALYYVRFTLNPLSGKLEEVVVEKNN